MVTEQPLTNIKPHTGGKDSTLNSQEEKEVLEKICNALCKAGYIRANFNGLTPFDKIAGGLMWCITGSDNLVNIGLLFGYGEELNIKKKILLSERIISALLHTTKRCPVVLHPHQIMGLDVDKIYSLVVWLIQQNYIFSNISYLPPKYVDKLIAFSVDQTPGVLLASLKNILFVLRKYKPVRKYKHSAPKKFTELSDKCIHEYINVTYVIKDSSMDYDHRKQYIKTNLTTVDPVNFTESLFDNLDNTKSHYDLLTQELCLSPALEDKSIAIKEIEKCEKIINNLQNEFDSLNQEMEQETSILEKMKFKNNELELNVSASEESKEKDDLYRQLHNMVNETKGVREEYSKLRSGYIEKQSKSKEEVENITEEDFNKQIQFIEELNNGISELEEKLAEEDKEISELEKLLDQPGPAELTMYQKRFFELYDQIAANTIETRQFYDLHNTLIDTKHYIEKEINLLNSVLDNYPRAMSSANYRDQFFNQLEGIVEWVNQTKGKIGQVLTSKKDMRDSLHQQWLSLMELEREYALVVSQLNSAATPDRKIHNSHLFN